MKSKASQQNRFLRIITVPIRALCRARDFYVKSMTDYADRMNCGANAIAIPGTSQVSGLPKSFSVGSARSYNSEDFQELVRAASARGVGEGIDWDSYIKQQNGGAGAGPPAMPPRSSSVVMGRIDEDRPYFGEDSNNNFIISGKNEIKYPRSKSHAVTTRRFPAF